jgi:hypothetical protein
MPETRPGQFENALRSRSANEFPQRHVHGRRVGPFPTQTESFLECFPI